MLEKRLKLKYLSGFDQHTATANLRDSALLRYRVKRSNTETELTYLLVNAKIMVSRKNRQATDDNTKGEMLMNYVIFRQFNTVFQ